MTKKTKRARVRPAIAAAFRRIPLDLSDTLTLGGIAATAYGAWMIHPPAGFIVGGLLYASFGVLMDLLQARPTRDEL